MRIEKILCAYARSSESKNFDSEFSPEALKVLKERDILGQANPAQFVPLIYNLYTKAETMVERFDAERRANPLLETTPPDAWLTAEIMRGLTEIRPNADIPEPVLIAALRRYFQRAAPLVAKDDHVSEQKLWPTVQPYLSALKHLTVDLCDRRKSLRRILGIRVGAHTMREAISEPKPSSLREALLLQGIREGWKNPRVARELDLRNIKPRSADYKSYGEMLRLSPQAFYALKSEVKKKYRAVQNSSEQSKA